MQFFVGPREVIHQGQGLTDAQIVELARLHVEHKASRARHISIRQRLFHDPTILNRGEIIGGRPRQRGIFLSEGELTCLEPLKRGRGVREVFDADRIKVILTDVQRMISAPEVGIANVDDLVIHLKTTDHIRPRTRSSFEAAFIQTRTRFLIPFLAKHWLPADLFDHGLLWIIGRKGEFHGIIVQRLNAIDHLRHRETIRFGGLFHHQVMAKDYVVRGHWGAVRKHHIVAQMEDHPIFGLGVFHRCAQIAVIPVHIVRCALQNRFEHGR